MGIAAGQVRSNSMGMTDKQEDVIDIAINKFQASTFTAGMLCEASGESATDCVKLLKELHAIGAVRCPVNDGGCALYEVIPELVFRAAAPRRR